MAWWVASTGLFCQTRGPKPLERAVLASSGGNDPGEGFQISTNVKICNRGRILLVGYELYGWLS